MITVIASADPGLVTGKAGHLVAGDPVGYNVVGSRLADAVRYGEPGRYWIALADEAPAAIAVQQPADAPLTLGPMRAELGAAIADAVSEAGVALPGVYGPAAAASHFAATWAELREATATLTSRERLYEVRDLRSPDGVGGRLRRAGAGDRELLLSWLPGFMPGARWAGSHPAAIFVTRRLAAGEVWIWDDGGPVSMAARTGAVAGVSRIQAVNTPPELRKRGYASAGVAALSARVLARGLRCVLYADTGNAAAVSVYRRLGYQPVSDASRYRLADREPGRTRDLPAGRPM